MTSSAKIKITMGISAVLLWTTFWFGGQSEAKKNAATDSVIVINVAHMPNVTHGQAVIGRAQKWFEERLGKNVIVRWQAFNAGPSIVEGIFGGSIDIAYVGPGPAVNGFVKSEGDALRVLAGAASGGAAFVVRNGSGIGGVKDLSGKRLATPQLGNTQDIALRGWLLEVGLKTKEKGGTVSVLPIANADQLTLFIKGQLDGAWTVEPWVSRLEQEGGGKILLDESQRWSKTGGKYATTLLVVRKEFLEKHPDVARAWVKAHVALTDWINANKLEAARIFNEELAREIGKPLSTKVLASAFARLEFTADPILASLEDYTDTAYALGFLGRKKPDLRGLCHTEKP